METLRIRNWVNKIIDKFDLKPTLRSLWRPKRYLTPFLQFKKTVKKISYRKIIHEKQIELNAKKLNIP